MKWVRCRGRSGGRGRKRDYMASCGSSTLSKFDEEVNLNPVIFEKDTEQGYFDDVPVFDNIQAKVSLKIIVY